MPSEKATKLAQQIIEDLHGAGYYASSRPVPLNEVCSIHLTTLFFLLVRLTARGYYVIANSFAGIIDCHQAPHRTVLALLTHTAPHQNRFTELE